MDLRIFTEPQQGASYDTLLAVARATEELGFDAFFRSDHYQRFDDASGLPGSTDAWITLAGLARETSRIRLGTLVTPGTFRYPGPLAISVAQIDAMSGGRVELGMGAGWFDREHHSYGIPFATVKERFDRLEEQLAVITGLWETPEGETFSFEGTHYQLADSPALPKPVQRPRPPIIIGGGGPKRTPRLAARYAQEFNMPFASVAAYAAQREVVAAACEAIGRAPSTMTWSIALTVCCGRDEAEIARRATAIELAPEVLRKIGAAGTPDEVIAKVKQYAALGVTRVYFQVLDLHDLDHLSLLAEKVAPALR